jgi:hypothetical protein
LLVCFAVEKVEEIGKAGNWNFMKMKFPKRFSWKRKTAFPAFPSSQPPPL